MRRLFIGLVSATAVFAGSQAHSAILASELNILTAAWHGCLLSTADDTSFSWDKSEELDAIFDNCARQEDAVLKLMQRADVSVDKARVAMRAFALPYLVSQTKLVTLKTNRKNPS